MKRGQAGPVGMGMLTLLPPKPSSKASEKLPPGSSELRSLLESKSEQSLSWASNSLTTALGLVPSDSPSLEEHCEVLLFVEIELQLEAEDMIWARDGLWFGANIWAFGDSWLVTAQLLFCGFLS